MFLMDPQRLHGWRSRSSGDKIKQVVLIFRLIHFIISAQHNLPEVLTCLKAFRVAEAPLFSPQRSDDPTL